MAAVVAVEQVDVQSLPRVAEKAVELVLGIPPTPPEPRKKQPMTAEEMKRVAGTYGNGQTTITLRVKDGQLTGAVGGVVSKVGENRYLRPAVGGTPETELTFSTGLDGQGAYLIRGGRALKKQ